MPDPPPLVRLTPSAALREKRLAGLLAGRDPAALRLDRSVEEAQVRGSLELAGLDPSDLAAAEALRRARRAVDATAPLDARSLRAWHHALTGDDGFRTSERERPDGPAPSPVAFIASRLAIVEEWLAADSARALKPEEQGALAYARLVEILPFESANARVARLAATHLMVRAGGRPPVLTGADGPRLAAAVAEAFAFRTEPLARLLAEAADRALDVMIAALERPAPTG